MKNRKHQLGAVFVILALCALAALPALGQGRGIRQAGSTTQMTRDPLAFLKQALNKAGAAALDSSQETALNSLITNFRNANRPGAPDAAQKAARDEYANAILSKNQSGAIAAADKLADLMSARQRAMLEAEANFQIQALSLLHSDQVASLQSSIGNDGILRVLGSLAGPGPGLGRGRMGGPGMMGPGTLMRPRNPR